MKLLFILIFSSASMFSFNATSAEAAVAMPDSYSALVAKKVLEDGGNAIDAAIAA